MEENILEQLEALYYDPANAGSYGGVERLLREARVRGVRASRRDVEAFLANQEAYARHKPARRRFERNRTYVKGIDVQWQADLAEVQHLASANNGIRYLLTCIDVFSKHAWVVPIKSKGAEAMVKAFGELFKRTKGRLPQRLQTDKGREFTCGEVQALLRAKHVHHFSSNSDMKAAVVERFNRTIKTRMWRYLTAKRTKRYADVLQRLVDSYNRSLHRSIGMAPADVRKQHEEVIWQRLYGRPRASSSSKQQNKSQPKPGEVVRISRWKGTFEKGYEPNWSKELFNVHRVIHDPHPMFELRDAKDEPLEGRFYAKELQRMRHGEFVVERVLAERAKPDGTQGRREVLVKWEGWPARYNSWVDKDTLQEMGDGAAGSDDDV